MKSKVVSYIRCSTSRQGASGLGLEGQRAAVEAFCHENGLELVAEYREVESGRKNDRPVLRQALARAKATKAILLIAKLDRLARNVAFIANLLEASVEFRACDMPDASRFVLHILAAVAEQEARACSERTRVALKAAKERGILLGASNPKCRRLTQQQRLKGAVASGKRTTIMAHEAYADVVPIVSDLRAQGKSLRAIAAELDARGVATRKGKTWSSVQVMRLLAAAA
ncbi:MAG TPA: recombinase family protein [Candidatus Cybelea sp.]|jgi:DNA invertase Pin-like site-specific DNA recombinase|nr:recombinase family protein [Candidatus Cybelea sp.]